MNFGDIASACRRREFREALPASQAYSRMAGDVAREVQSNGDIIPKALGRAWKDYTDTMFKRDMPKTLDACVALANMRTCDLQVKNQKVLDTRLDEISKAREELLSQAKAAYRGATGESAAKLQDICRDIQTL